MATVSSERHNDNRGCASCAAVGVAPAAACAGNKQTYIMRDAVITTYFAPWHWQDKFDAQDPVDAHREQLLKIEKRIPFAKWLKAKRTDEQRRQEYIAAALAAKREEAQKERDAKAKERKEYERRQREEEPQRREERIARELADVQQRDAARVKTKHVRVQRDKVKREYTDIMRSATSQSKSKPTTARPSFKQWAAKKKRESRNTGVPKTPPADPCHAHHHSNEDARVAYERWVELKRSEDRVKRTLAAEAKAAYALETKLAHERAWQKKAIVCAYSQNRSEKEPAWRAATLS